MTIGYVPNVPAPFDGDETPNLQGILAEVKKGCPSGEKARVHAIELTEYYEGDSEKYLPFKPAEDALSWLTKPKRVSFITRQAVDKLTSHLYKPGPRERRVTSDPDVNAWYRRVAQDLHLNSLMKRVDQLVTLHGLCAIGCYTTGVPSRPLGYHLFPRQEFDYWTDPGEPRVAVAVCTITTVRPDVARYRLWTASHYYTFFKGRDWGYQPGGWGAARFDPASSGPHGYGRLPFVIPTHELPTTTLAVKGLGKPLVKINKALNVDKSNLALWVHLYAKPLGFVKGVGPDWRPKFLEGGFVPLVVKWDSTEDAPVIPEASYLQSDLDIDGVWRYIQGEANQALAELGVPLKTAVQSDGGAGTMAASGLAIAADEAGLITYSKGRQTIFEVHERDFAQLACQVGASGGVPLAGALETFARDPQLRVVWAEPRIDLPGPAQDTADTWELEQGLSDPIEVLMRRQGLTEPEAVDQYTKVQRRKALAAKIAAEAGSAVIEPGSDDASTESEPVRSPEGTPRRAAGDMGVPADDPAVTEATNAANPHVSVTVAVDPQMEIPAAPLLLPATPGYGTWGTEN